MDKKEIYKKEFKQLDPDWHELFNLVKQNKRNLMYVNISVIILSIALIISFAY